MSRESSGPVIVPAAAPSTVVISVVLPCLNEGPTVARCVADALAAISSLGVVGEILVVDDGSVDGSGHLAGAAGARVVHPSHGGYGAAVRRGIECSVGTYVLVADADATYDLGCIPSFLDRLHRGDDLVVGDRFAGGIEPGAMPLLNRYLGNPVLSGVARRVFGTDVRDFHCGVRAFDRRAVAGLQLSSDGMELATEMIAKAARAGLVIGQVPVSLLAGAPGRRSHLRPFRDGVRHLRLMWRLRRS